MEQLGATLFIILAKDHPSSFLTSLANNVAIIAHDQQQHASEVWLDSIVQQMPRYKLLSAMTR